MHQQIPLKTGKGLKLAQLFWYKFSGKKKIDNGYIFITPNTGGKNAIRKTLQPLTDATSTFHGC